MNNSNTEWFKKEIAWWNTFSETMGHQWRLNPAYNWILRRSLNKRIKNFFSDQTTEILDLGCGSGWVTSIFLNEKIQVLGIDFSEEQIKYANQVYMGSNLKFECKNIVNWDTADYVGKFDGVLIYAFLHHLPEEDILKVFGMLNKVLKQGGKIFLYEPVWFSTSSSSSYAFLDKLLSKSASLFVYRLPSWLNWWNKDYQDVMKRGYTGSSPMERPLSFAFLAESLRSTGFTIEDVKPEHVFSLPLGMLSMSMKTWTHPFYYFLSFVYSFFEVILFTFFDWKKFSKKERFFLCSITAKRA